MGSLGFLLGKMEDGFLTGLLTGITGAGGLGRTKSGGLVGRLSASSFGTSIEATLGSDSPVSSIT